MKSSNNTTPDTLIDEGHRKLIVCGGCELLCEDLTTQSIESGTGCALSDNWFSHGELEPESMIDGKKAPLTEAINMAARRLLASRRPLITGLVSTTIDTIQIACTLAEKTHAAIDANAPETSILTAPTAIRIGDVTADFEELRDRADLAIFWDCSPSTNFQPFIKRFIRPKPQNNFRHTISIGPTSLLPPTSHNLHFAVQKNDLVSLARMVQARIEQKASRKLSSDLGNIADKIKESIDNALCIGIVSSKTADIKVYN